MESAKVEELLQQLAQMIHSLDKDISDMKASIAALKVFVASQLNPDDPSVGIEHIHTLEKVAHEADPNRERLLALGDVIDAVKLIRKHGSHET